MLALAVLLSVVPLGCSVADLLAGCRAIAPHELPSGAPPGDGVEDVAGGAKQVVSGAGRDRVEQRVGVSYYAADFDELVDEVEVRGQPGVVYRVTVGEPDPAADTMLSWAEDGCDRTLIFDSRLSDAEIAAYAARY
jgi:hypothetical protein